MALSVPVLRTGATLFRHLHRPMVVAMIAMGMMQMAVYQIIDVVAMRDRFMPAGGAVLVGLVVLAAVVFGGAVGGIGAADGQAVLVHVVAMLVMQVAVV